MQPRIIIIGGGIAGLTAAIALKQKGLDSTIYDAPRATAHGTHGIGLGANALEALDRIHLRARCIELGHPLSDMKIVSGKGQLLSTANFSSQTDNEVGYAAILRTDFLHLLQDHLDHKQLITEQRCLQVTEHDDAITVHLEDGKSIEADLVICADGLQSAIRQQLFPTAKLRHASYRCWSGYSQQFPKELSAHSAVELWGRAGRIGIVPLRQQRAYYYICLNEYQAAKLPLMTTESFITYFQQYPSYITDVLSHSDSSTLTQQFIYDLEPMKQFSKGRVVLLGDAAHAATPNLGQGGCQAIEDAVLFAETLRAEASIPAAITSFETQRIQRVNQVIRDARLIGMVAQLDNPIMQSLRDRFMPLISSSLAERQMRNLLQFDKKR